jgi:hypothetical protein
MESSMIALGINTGKPPARCTSDAAGKLYERCTAIGIDFLGAVASDHLRGVPLARVAGVTADAFIDEDLRAIWLAIEASTARGDDKVTAAKLVRALLRRLGFWCADGPVGYGGQWNDESLARLFCSWPGPSAVRVLAARLMNAASRWREAEWLSIALHAVLMPSDSASTGTDRERVA